MMEARNRFKGLDVIDRVPDELGTEARDHSHRKVMQKSKMAVWRGLTNSREEKRSKKQRRNERYKHLNAEFQRRARRDKAFLRDQCKGIE